MSIMLQHHHSQWCIAKTGGGYTQTGVAKGLKVPCLFMITEVSIRSQKNSGSWYRLRRIPAYTPQCTTDHSCTKLSKLSDISVSDECRPTYRTFIC